ncbi:MAG: hypothetical protein RIE32_01140 [Phycisphaerales bacterium]
MRLKLGGVAIVGLGLAVGTPALGQQGDTVMITSTSAPGGVHRGGRALSRETMQRMGEVLGLDEIQLDVAFEMFKEFADQRQQLNDRLRQDLEAARKEVTDGDFGAMMARMKEVNGAHQSAVAELEQTLFRDMRAMLSPEQDVLWEQAERIHRRAKNLGSLTRSEARVDLDDLVRTEFADAYGQPAVTEVLERWAVHVDGLLVERMRKAEDIGGGPGFNGGVFIFDGEEDPYEPLRTLDARIATAGQQAVRTLAGVLEHDRVESAWLRQAYSRVYKKTSGERRLEAAMGLATLDEAQRDQLQAAADQHERDVAAARDRWVVAEREREAEDRLPPGVVLVVHGQDPSPSDEAEAAVLQLDERLESKLTSILRAEQLAELPKAESELRFEFTPGSSESRTIRSPR